MPRKVKLSRAATYRIIEVMPGNATFLGKRVRLTLTEPTLEVKPNPLGFLEGLSGLLLSGKQAGSRVSLPLCKLKTVNPRKCRCTAYTFPHAPSLGKCEAPLYEPEAPEALDLDALFKGL